MDEQGGKKRKDVFFSNYKNVKDSKFVKDTLGETYEEKSGLQQEIIVDFFSKCVKPRVNLDDRILDLGCGTGNTTLKFLPLIGERGFILGTDVSEGMIKTAKEKENKNLKFDVADALTFSQVESVKSEEDFNIFFSSHMLHWVEDKKTVFEQIFHRLKKGGCFISTFAVIMSPDTPTSEIMDECADELLKDETEHVAIFMTSPEEITDHLKSIGFEIEYLNFYIPLVEFKGKDEEDVMKKLSSHYETILTLAADKPEKRKELLNLIARKTFETSKSPNHRWSKIMVEGKPVNYFMVEHRGEEEEEEVVLKMRCEIIEFVARKK